MKPTIDPNGSEADDLLNDAYEAMDAGTKCPGMSYEDGIRATIEWMRDPEANENPLAD